MFTDEEALTLHHFYSRSNALLKGKDIYELTTEITSSIYIAANFHIDTAFIPSSEEKRKALTLLLPKITPESIEWYQQNYPEYTI